MFSINNILLKLRNGSVFVFKKTWLLSLFILIPYTILFLEQKTLDYLYRHPKHLVTYVEVQPAATAHSASDIRALSAALERATREHKVANRNRHDAASADSVLLVQVHRDAGSLRYLIQTLEEARYIETVLLVFSHSYFSEELNALINSIDFCRVMQIYYPHSRQLQPTPETVACEHKRHWWWKAQHLFKYLETVNYKGYVMFLEEDHFVAPDFLFMFRHTQRASVFHPDVEVISMGEIENRLEKDNKLLTLSPWTSSLGYGLAFNASTWRKISTVGPAYCGHGDSGWAQSLQYALATRARGLPVVLACARPRVLARRRLQRYELVQVRSEPWFPRKVSSVAVFGRAGRVDLLPGRQGPRPAVVGPPDGRCSPQDRTLCHLGLRESNRTAPESHTGAT